MKKYLWGVSILVLGMMMSAFSWAANNPVIQIVGYDAVGGRYPNMLEWGSASIISKDGLILTNSHVVDNGRGGTLPGFSICITVDDAQRPKCHYTASLIARDIRRDVALLRIDPVDIFGKSVDYNSLTSIELDYSYVPKAQDTVVAIGYPWVGANTITKTQGVVAGTQLYNDVTYIKTDALTAGGNSGGPLVLNGKVIGINTFGIGGLFDPSLGYALSVAEIQDFVTENSTKSATAISPRLAFTDYLRRLETINMDRKVSDSFVTMKFDTSYKMTHYIPNLQLRGEISNPDIYHVQQFNIQRVNIPKFKDKKQQEYFLKNQMQLYGGEGWWGQKLKIKKIGGLDFYEPLYEADPSGGESYGYKRYFTVVDGTMVIITLYAPLGDENTHDQVKANIDSFLGNISFGSITSLPRQDFTLYTPSISLPTSDQSLVDIFGQMNRGFSEYYGWSSNYVTYLDNLFETISISIIPNTIWGGKGKTAQQLLDADLADSYGPTYQEKGLVNYYGNEGYMICEDQGLIIADQIGRRHQMVNCNINLVVGSKQEYVIKFTLNVRKKLIDTYKTKFFAFVDKVMKPLGDASKGVTIADELKERTNQVRFNDIADQDPSFQKFVTKLATWGILKSNPSFNGDYPLQWQDYTKLYLKMVYNKNLTDIWSGSMTYGDVIATLPYNPTAFVPMDQISAFETILKIKLAGVNYSDFSKYGLSRFEHLKDTTYKDQWNQIEEWEYTIYGQRIIQVHEVFGSIGSWYSDYTTTYNPITKLLQKNLTSSKDPIRLDQGLSLITLNDINAQSQCYASKVSIISTKCLDLWRKQVIQYASYPVLTKGEAINSLLYKMDIGLFDSYRANKKETQIEE